MSEESPTLSRRSVLRALGAVPVALGVAPALIGCGGEEEASTGGAVEASGEQQSFTITVGDSMQYDVTEMRVGAGDEVTVTITHTGSMTAQQMGHNFVLLAQGVQMSAFAQAAVSAADSGYIPPGREADIIAHTRLVGGGESDSVTFTAPAPGTYQYCCTFPGHFASMNGTFVVS